MQKQVKEIMNLKTSSSHRESTPFSIRKHAENVNKLKKTAQRTFQFQFFHGPARSISTGKEIGANVISGLLSSVQLGDTSFNQFIEDRFMKGTISIYDKIPKIKIQTGLKKKITKSKPVQVLQEDVQGFGILAEQNISLEEAFRYPLTKLPLSISEGISNLRTGSKSTFRNHLAETYGFTKNVSPHFAIWIYDASRVICSESPRSTYLECFDILIEKMTPTSNVKPKSVRIILDRYIGKGSTKSCTRSVPGENNSSRIYITGFGQSMPSTTSQWQSALENGETKKSLMSLFAEYITSGNVPLPYDTVINKENDMWYIDHETKECRIIYLCNHEEADTRMIADAATLGTNYIVLSAYDSDVFFLGVYSCALDTSRHWWIEYKSECYIDLQDIAKTLDKFAVSLPTFHAIRVRIFTLKER